MPGLPSAARLRKLAGQAFTRQPSDHLDLRIRAGPRRGRSDARHPDLTRRADLAAVAAA